MIQVTKNRGLRSLFIQIFLVDNNNLGHFAYFCMKTRYSIRLLVEKALDIKKLTPEIENEINWELTQMGYISDIDYEALELLMAEMDAGRIQLVPSIY